jgi:hypothetical protein
MACADDNVMDLGQIEEETQIFDNNETQNDEEIAIQTGETGIKVWLDDEIHLTFEVQIC